MKFDVKTIEILKNFNTINPSILFKEGDVISTVSSAKTILARAVIDQEFPKEFAIYDLSQFLGALSVMPEAEIDFGENQLTMKSKNSKINYTYASPSMIVASPYKEIKMDNVIASFDLPFSSLTTIIKAASVLQLSDITIMSDDDTGDILIKAVNTKEPTSNDYTIKVGQTSADFEITFKVENLKLLNRDYRVEVPDKGFVKFSDGKISYWIAASIA